MEICKLIVELEDLIDLPIDIIPLDEAPPKLLQRFSLRIIAIVRGARLLSELTKKALAEITNIDFKTQKKSVDIY